MLSEEIIRNSVAFSATIVVFGLMVWLFFNDRGGAGMVVAWLDSSGRLRSKKFNVRKYGDAEAFRLACEYRKLKIQELIDSGEWYDPLHGI